MGSRCLTWTSLHSLAEVMGCRWEVYEQGIEMPPGFKKRWAPSRHSGESSLSPKEPSSSLTRMSACSGASHARMSTATIVTRSCHLSWRASEILKMAASVSSTYSSRVLQAEGTRALEGDAGAGTMQKLPPAEIMTHSDRIMTGLALQMCVLLCEPCGEIAS